MMVLVSRRQLCECALNSQGTREYGYIMNLVDAFFRALAIWGRPCFLKSFYEVFMIECHKFYTGLGVLILCIKHKI